MNTELENALRKSFEVLTKEELINMAIILMDESLHGRGNKISEGHKRNKTKEITV